MWFGIALSGMVRLKFTLKRHSGDGAGGWDWAIACTHMPGGTSGERNQKNSIHIFAHFAAVTHATVATEWANIERESLPDRKGVFERP